MGRKKSGRKRSDYNYLNKDEVGKDLITEDPEYDKLVKQRENEERWKPTSGHVTQSLGKFIRTVERYGKFYALKNCKMSQKELDELLLHNLSFKKLYYEALSLTELQVNFIEVHRKKMGNIGKTCEVVGISRSTYNHWMTVSETFKREVDATLQSLFDDLETVMLQKAVVEKDTQMLIWLSKTKMKDRGYVDSKQVDNTHRINHQEVKNLSDDELEARIRKLELERKKQIDSGEYQDYEDIDDE